MQNQVTDRRVEEILSGMTVEDKVGQLFIVRRPQDDGVGDGRAPALPTRRFYTVRL